MGMLVDNVIVIIDGILVDLKVGKDWMEVMIVIGWQIVMLLLEVILIVIIVFLLIYMLLDMVGVYMCDFFIVFVVFLLLSWILVLIYVLLMVDCWLYFVIDIDSIGK